MRGCVVFGGSSHPSLAKHICRHLNIPIGDCTLGKFSNGETSVVIKESVRDQDVYIVQSGCGHVDDNVKLI